MTLRTISKSVTMTSTVAVKQCQTSVDTRNHVRGGEKKLEWERPDDQSMFTCNVGIVTNCATSVFNLLVHHQTNTP